MSSGSVGVRLRALHRQLLAAYGPQGWWPVPRDGGSPRRGFDPAGYHSGDYRTPRTPADRFEVIMGAVLTQNTAWTNASAALKALLAARVRRPADALALPLRRVARLVRSSGSFNQKAKKLRSVAKYFSLPGSLSGSLPPSREALLALWGIGPETADSILLYAFQVPVFVVDAYTRRILVRIGLIQGRETYDEIQSLFHASLSPDSAMFNEFHALIVEHAKAHCRSRPVCDGCPVTRCLYRDRPETAGQHPRTPPLP